MKRNIATTIIVAVVLLHPAASAFADHSEKEEVLGFLRNHVIGRTISVTDTSRLPNTAMETDFSRRTTFANLRESKEGFTFDEIVSIEQTNFDLDDNGKRIKPGRSEDRTLVIRHYYELRKSTGEVLGYTRVPVNSWGDSTGAAYFSRIDLDEKALTVTRSTIGYGDFFGSEGTYWPGAVQVKHIYTVDDNNKLRRENLTTTYEVNPQTLERTLKSEEPSRLVDKETSASKVEGHQN